jgi:hypothetical protein
VLLREICQAVVEVVAYAKAPSKRETRFGSADASKLIESIGTTQTIALSFSVHF